MIVFRVVPKTLSVETVAIGFIVGLPLISQMIIKPSAPPEATYPVMLNHVSDDTVVERCSVLTAI